MKASKPRLLDHRVRFLAVVLFALLGATAGLAQSQLYAALYQYQNGQLISMDLDGGNPHTLFTAGSYPVSDWLPVGLDLDDAGRIYWTHGVQPGLVRRADLDGGNQALVAGSLKYPRGCAVDPVGGKVYWTESPTQGNAGGIIRRRNIDGSGVTEEVYRIPNYSDMSRLGRPTVDAVNGYLYFIADGKVQRMNLDGPPFTVTTLADGASTGLRVLIDVASRQIYWADSDTISDCVVRVDFNNENYTVLTDRTPDYFCSSGFGDMAIDWTGGRIYLGDEIPLAGNPVILSCDLGGGPLDTIYTAPDGAACVALTLDARTDQVLEDCNGNGTTDRLDISTGASADCNGNGIPDECEDDPCATPNYLLDQGLNLAGAQRSLGVGISTGQPTNYWEIFQPFIVPAEGWDVGAVWLNGRTNNYNAAGFTATILPDNAGMPDETQALAGGTGCFRYSASWVKIPVNVTLPAGQYWVRLTGNATFEAGVYVGTSGLASLSRKNGTSWYTGQPAIALRLLPAEAGLFGDLNGDCEVNLQDLARLLSNYGMTSGAVYEDGDLDGDGDVDLSDLAALLTVYGTSC